MKLLLENWRKFINEEEVLTEKCWDGYKQAGLKNKGGRMVPNCVPLNESDDSNFTVSMDPQDFLTLTYQDDADIEGRSDYIVGMPGGFDKAKAGKLSLVIKKCYGDDVDKVISHAGRARSMAAMKSGIEQVPVILTFVNCEEQPVRGMSGLSFTTDRLEGQFDNSSVSVDKIGQHESQGILDLDTRVEMSVGELLKVLRITSLEKSRSNYRMADLVLDLNKEYNFMFSDGPEQVKVIVRNGLRFPGFESDPPEDSNVKVSKKE
tara:strand:+ start:207 stop:995 length:789 start_codon:yes stop_codon:yes gene_type:complete